MSAVESPVRRMQALWPLDRPNILNVTYGRAFTSGCGVLHHTTIQTGDEGCERAAPAGGGGGWYWFPVVESGR